MPLEPPLPASAQQKLQQLREQIDEALHGLVADMLALASAERDAALSEARSAAQQDKEAALETVRQECEAAVAERVAETARPPEEPSLAERLAAAVADADAAHALLASAVAERDEARQALAASNAARDQAVEAIGALNAERNQAVQALAESNAERDRSAQALTDAASEAALRLAEARAAADAAKAEAAERIEEARAAADRRIDDARTEAAAEAASERTRSEQTLADLRTEAEARLARSQAEAADRVAELEADADRRLAEAKAKAEGEARAAAAAELQQARIGDRECDLACVERVVDAMRALDEASSLSATLDTLADHLAAHVARVAILVVRDGELRIWTTAGFGEEILQAPSISVRLDGGTVVARAAQTGERTTTPNGTGEKPFEPLAFASLPPGRVGLAVPLRIGGRTVAVVYADEGASGERTVPSAWPEVVEILGRHSAACLELLTLTAAYALQAHRPNKIAAAASGGSSTTSFAPARPAATEAVTAAQGDSSLDSSPADAEGSQAAEEDASAIRYARLLISEIKLYHEDAVTEGREEADLLARLGPEISRARRLYEERVPAEVRNRADHFGQELVRTLANGDPRLLGQNT